MKVRVGVLVIALAAVFVVSSYTRSEESSGTSGSTRATAPAETTSQSAMGPGMMGCKGMGMGMMSGSMPGMGMMHMPMMGMMGGCPMMERGAKLEIEKVQNGVKLTITSNDPKVARRIQTRAEIMRLMRELNEGEAGDVGK